MALRYNYECSLCGLLHEKAHSAHETPEYFCDVCGHSAPPLRRVILKAPATHLKGVGWFKDGYSTTDRETDATALKADRINAKVANDTAKKGGGGIAI
jgi:predicted nucleic acid-binding Zn ribbon protein